jgi:hypothetical protein
MAGASLASSLWLHSGTLAVVAAEGHPDSIDGGVIIDQAASVAIGAGAELDYTDTSAFALNGTMTLSSGGSVATTFKATDAGLDVGVSAVLTLPPATAVDADEVTSSGTIDVTAGSAGAPATITATTGDVAVTYLDIAAGVALGVSVNGALQNKGEISLGSALSVLAVTGNFEQQSNSTLSLYLPFPPTANVIVSGTMTVDSDAILDVYGSGGSGDHPVITASAYAGDNDNPTAVFSQVNFSGNNLVSTGWKAGGLGDNYVVTLS